MSSLKAIDSILRNFSTRVNGTLTKDNDKGQLLPFGFEERSISWTKNQINFLIQIFPTITDDKIKGWNFWICGSLKKGGERFWKQRLLIEKGNKDLMISNIKILLKNAITELEELKEEDLEKVN